MGWWSVKIESDFIKKLNSMLKSKCVRLEIDGLTERLRDMEFAMANAAEVIANVISQMIKMLRF